MLQDQAPVVFYIFYIFSCKFNAFNSLSLLFLLAIGFLMSTIIGGYDKGVYLIERVVIH